MKIGIYGGSFNPIHKGHIYVASAAIQQFQLNQLILMPSYQSPNKRVNSLLDSDDRIEMCRLATQDYPNIIVSDYEIKKKGVSYTYLTMEHFSKEYERDSLHFIMGADSLDYLENWVHPELICKYAHILVIPREGFAQDQMLAKIDHLKALFSCRISLLQVPTYPVSSTMIRNELLKAPNQRPEGLDEKVYDYIKKNGLYSK